jgi:hypothetical protein
MSALQMPAPRWTRDAGVLLQSSAIERRPGAEAAREEAWTGRERRQEIRYETCDPVQVHLLDLAGLRVPGVVRDISKSGLRVEISMPVVFGARLKIRLRSHAIFGEVRYCRKAMNAYQVGVAIDDVYFSPRVADETGAKPELSSLASHTLARFIVDDHLYPPYGNFVESHCRRLPPASSAGVQ